VKSQSKLASLTESIANIVVGLGLQVAGAALAFHVLDVQITTTKFAWFTGFMTVLSLARSYCLRRLWNAEWWKRFKRPSWQDVYLREVNDRDEAAERKQWLEGNWDVQSPCLDEGCPHYGTDHDCRTLLNPHRGAQTEALKKMRFDKMWHGRNW
jgi:hypothetical protein